MKYTFQRKDVVDFLCSKCYNLNTLTFNTEITGDPEDAITPRFAAPYVHSSIITCGRCGGKMFAVDHNIGKYIQELNLLGFETKYCCGGHHIKGAINPRVVGPNIEPGDDSSDYPYFMHDIRKWTDRAKASIHINDIRGLPEHSEWTEEPYIMFSHNMRDIEKETLLYACEKVFAKYNCFIAKLEECNKHGVVKSTNSVKIGETDYSLVVIKRDKETINKDIDIVKEFESMLIDLIITLTGMLPLEPVGKEIIE